MTMQTTRKPSHPSFKLFGEVSGVCASESLVRRFCRNIGSLPTDQFEAANAVTNRLLQSGWCYGLHEYKLKEMMRRKAGNCLGLSCLFGAVLEFFGFQPKFELVVGPKGYQSKDEQDLLDHMLCGRAFSFHSPLLPERPAKGEKLSFATLEHPRLVLDGKRFETTILQEQGPSEVRGEYVRHLNGYENLAGLVCYERAHGARIGYDFVQAEKFHGQALELDPENHGVFAEQAETALEIFDDDLFFQARDNYERLEADHSNYRLQKYLMFGNITDLDLALRANPTNMLAWTQKNVVLERDAGNQRFNFAIAAQCVARSEALSLGDFYTAHAAELVKLFPSHAVTLVKRSLGSSTDVFCHNLALALIGSCKNIRWFGKSSPQDHLAQAFRLCPQNSPLQKTKLLFAARRLSTCNGEWSEHCSKFRDRETFRSAVDLLRWQWQAL